VIIVTGASRGLGQAIIERLVESGEEVLGLARNTSGMGIDAIECDVSDYASVKNASKEVKRMKKPLKAFINAAGVASMNMAVTTDESTVQKLIQTNLVGTIYCCQLFAPIMLRQKQGSFINFSTIAVALALKGESVYAASKAGVESFSRTFAREMADFNVRVNCIAPGPIRTDLLRGITDMQIEKITSQQVIPKQFQKSDVCDLVELLIDKKAASLSGQVLNVGGV
jgi:3-oxoacyl-[acyl-carrier protein] reductase